MQFPTRMPGHLTPRATLLAGATGEIIAYFAGGGAAFDLQLGLLVNGVDTGVFGLDNKTSMIGQSLPLGHANAGAALTFVLNNTDGDIIKKAYSDPTMNVSYDIDVHADTSMYIRRPQLRGFLASHREAIDCDAK